jgi:hypothetical protein
VLLYEEETLGKTILMQLPIQGERKPVPLVGGEFVGRSARFSPDGRWIAYVSNETGRDEIYLRGMAGAGGKWMISPEGGIEPRWSRTGRELFFLSDGMLMSVGIQVEGEALHAGVPIPVFTTPKTRWYDVSPDGQHFLIPVNPKAGNEAICVVLNWEEDLRR